MIYFLAFLKGISIIPIDERIIILKKGKRELLLRKSILKKCIFNFERIFRYSINSRVDLTKKYFEINFFGRTIKTDLEQVREIDYAILKYNMKYKLKKGDIVFDLGGYHGLYSVFASRDVGPTGKVYVFEPDPVNFEILKDNLERNKITNVILLNKAISNKTETQKFFIKGHGSRIVSSDFKTNTKDALITIPTIRLSDYIKNNKIQKIDFIKADIEGEEIELVDDYLKNLLPGGIKPKMAIASYHYRKELKENTSRSIAKAFKDKGIKVNIGNKKHLCVFI